MVKLKRTLAILVVSILCAGLFNGVVFAQSESVELITSEEQLVALLNTRFVEKGKIYTLERDMTIKASDLDKELFKPDTISINNLPSFQSSFDGNHKTIKVVVEEGQSSRALFARINGPSNEDKKREPNKITFKDLTVQYTGDVEGAGLATIDIYAIDMSNINIKLEDDAGGLHDIIPIKNPLGYDAPIQAYYAAGLTDSLNSGVFRYPGLNDTTTTEVRNVKIKARTIGTPTYTTEAEAGVVTDVSGFARYIGTNLSIDGVEIDVQDIYAIHDNPVAGTSSVAGFSSDIMHVKLSETDYIKNIKVNVANNIESYAVSQNNFGLSNCGTYGLFRNAYTFQNAELHIGGDLIHRTGNGDPTFTTKDETSVVVIGFAMEAGESDKPHYNNISVNIGGSVKSLSNGDGFVLLGLYGKSSRSKAQMQDIKVNIAQDVICESTGTHPVPRSTPLNGVYGMAYNMNNGVDNAHTYIGGGVSVKSNRTTGKLHTAAFYGHSVVSASSTMSGKVTNSSITVEGKVDVRSDNSTAAFVAFQSGSSKQIENNKSTYLSDIHVESRGEGKSSYALGSGFANSSANGYIGSYKNNMAYIKGDLTVESESQSIATGFAYTMRESTTMEDNLLRIDGGIRAIARDVDTPFNPDADPEDQEFGYSMASGGIINAQGDIKNNAVYVNGSAKATVTESGEPESSSFALYVYATASIKENTVLGRPATHEEGDTINYYEKFAADVHKEAKVEDNFYTSILGGQRVTNLLAYDHELKIFTIEAGKQLLLEVAEDTSYTEKKDYIVSNEFDTVSIIGSGTAALDGNSLTAESLANVKLSTVIDGKTAVLDIPGIGYAYPANIISGNVFADVNKNGVLDENDMYASDAVVEVLYDDTVVAKGIIGSDGTYSIEMPLLNAQANELVFKLSTDNDMYSLSEHTNNQFTNKGSITKQIDYFNPFVINGVFDAETFTVEFNSQGGTEVDSIPYVAAGSTINAPADPEREGFEFTGWYKDAGCSNLWDFTSDKVSEDTTLFAGWEEVNIPTTGDIMNVLLIVLFLVSLSSVIILSSYKKKRSYNYRNK